MRCDIIVVSWNQAAMIAAALDSIHRNAGYPYRLIVVDNDSDAETVSMLREAERTGRYGEMKLILNQENKGWTGGINQGLDASDAPYVCVMNNDVLTGRDWLRNMVATMERHPDVGLANPEERRIVRQNTLSDIDAHALDLAQDRSGEFTELGNCSGFCMLIRRSVIERIGKFDEIFGAGYYEDEDFCRRALAAGFHCIRCHDALVLHLESQSFGKNLERKKELGRQNRLIYQKRWGRTKRILVLAKHPASEEILELARKDNVVYVIENRFVNRRTMSRRHTNIKFRGKWPLPFGDSLAFLIKATYLHFMNRIDSALIMYVADSEIT